MKTFLMGMFVAACLSGSALSAQAQEPVTLVWGDDARSETGFDSRVSSSRNAAQIMQQVYDAMIYMDKDGKMHPWLAASWSMAPDAKSIHFKLRPGVKFHDGTPLDAEAVKFTLDSIVDPATGSQSAIDTLGPYDRTDVIGSLELVVHYKTPYAAAVESFATRNLAVVSPTAVRKLGNAAFARAPVGSGPYKFVSWEQDSKIVLERNEDYAWAPEGSSVEGLGQAKQIVFRFVPEASTRVAALEAGEIDLAETLPPLDLRRLSDSGDYAVDVSIGQGIPTGFLLNVSHGPFSDIRVRKAFIFAINRPRLVQNLFFGFNTQAYGPMSKSMVAYWPGVEDYYKFDAVKAGALLDEAGWTMGSDGYRAKDGQRLSVYLPALFDPDTAVAVQADLKRIGMELKVENVMKAKQDELIMSNQYDLGFIRWLKPDAAVLEVAFHSKNIPGPGKFKFNWSRYDDAKLDKLLDDARSALDPAKRKELYDAAQRFIMDEAIYAPLYDQVTSVTHRKAISNVEFFRGNGNFQVNYRTLKVAAGE